MAYLLVLKGASPKQSFPLDKERTLLGRNASCDIVFPANDFAVSREHACIVRAQAKFFIEDLGSRNGTYVNNVAVSGRMPLKEADRIRICDFLYSFHESKPEPVSAPNPEMISPTLDEIEELSGFEASVSNTSQLLLESQPSEKLRALVDISNNLSKTLELEPLLPKIVESLFQLFKQADRGFIIMREEATERERTLERLIPTVIKTRRGQDETSASFSRSIVRECIRTVQAFLSDDATTDKRFNMSQSISDFKIRSVMCAPLWSQDNKAFGVIQLDTQDRSKKFTQEDLSLLMAVANQASIALENARMHEDILTRERLRRDLELAHQVQLSFLPRQLPAVAGYEFFACYEPAQEVGGDYYGFIPLADKRGLAIMLGDVAGKGVPAALLMAKLSSDARFCLLSQPDPAAAITFLNNSIYPNTSQMDRFVTLAAAFLDPVANRVTIVNAGHPAPRVYRHALAAWEEISGEEPIGLPLGIIEDFPYQAYEMELQAGDCVAIFSDGVTEAMDKDNNPLSDKAIYDAVKDGPLAPRAMGERIIKLVKHHAVGCSQHDDITLLCFGRVSDS